MQKIGHNNKAMKQYDEHKKRVNEAAEAKRMAGEDGNDQGEAEDDSILIKINRVATRTALRWKRSTSTSTEMTQGRSSCLAVERAQLHKQAHRLQPVRNLQRNKPDTATHQNRIPSYPLQELWTARGMLTKLVSVQAHLASM